MVSSRSLEAILEEIRANTDRFPGEGLDAFNQRTWHLALMRWEQEKPELPRVKAIREQSVQASKRAGRPEKPKEDE